MPAEATPTPAPKRRGRRPPADRSNHERWLVSYADFVTLLFAVFTSMYAISSVDAKKLGSFVGSLQHAFESGSGFPRSTKHDATNTSGHLLVATNPPRLSVGAGPGGEIALGDVQARITERLARQIADNRVEIEMDRRGLVISIREAGSFAVGSAELTPDAQLVLQQLGATLSEIGNRVRIEGHTDDVPIHTARFASNWELSTARATNVIAFFLARSEIRPERLSAAGYGEYYPRVANTTDAGRARNRRVDLVILNPSTETAEEPAKLAGPQ